MMFTNKRLILHFWLWAILLFVGDEAATVGRNQTTVSKETPKLEKKQLLTTASVVSSGGSQTPWIPIFISPSTIGKRASRLINNDHLTSSSGQVPSVYNNQRGFDGQSQSQHTTRNHQPNIEYTSQVVRAGYSFGPSTTQQVESELRPFDRREQPRIQIYSDPRSFEQRETIIRQFPTHSVNSQHNGQQYNDKVQSQSTDETISRQPLINYYRQQLNHDNFIGQQIAVESFDRPQSVDGNLLREISRVISKQINDKNQAGQQHYKEDQHKLINKVNFDQPKPFDNGLLRQQPINGHFAAQHNDFIQTSNSGNHFQQHMQSEGYSGQQQQQQTINKHFNGQQSKQISAETNFRQQSQSKQESANGQQYGSSRQQIVQGDYSGQSQANDGFPKQQHGDGFPKEIIFQQQMPSRIFPVQKSIDHEQSKHFFGEGMFSTGRPMDERDHDVEHHSAGRFLEQQPFDSFHPQQLGGEMFASQQTFSESPSFDHSEQHLSHVSVSELHGHANQPTNANIGHQATHNDHQIVPKRLENNFESHQISESFSNQQPIGSENVMVTSDHGNSFDHNSHVYILPTESVFNVNSIGTQNRQEFRDNFAQDIDSQRISINNHQQDGQTSLPQDGHANHLDHLNFNGESLFRGNLAERNFDEFGRIISPRIGISSTKPFQHIRFHSTGYTGFRPGTLYSRVYPTGLEKKPIKSV